MYQQKEKSGSCPSEKTTLTILIYFFPDIFKLVYIFFFTLDFSSLFPFQPLEAGNMTNVYDVGRNSPRILRLQRSSLRAFLILFLISGNPLLPLLAGLPLKTCS